MLSKFLSILPFYYFIFLGFTNVYLLFTNIVVFKQLFLYTLGIISATLFSEIIKKFAPIPNILKHLWYRPRGAKGCDYLSIKGYAPEFTPGFPSGHMTTTSYFVMYNLLLLNGHTKNISLKYLFIGLNIVLLLLMGWARIHKKCHNIVQVVCGSIFGSAIAYMFYKLNFLI